MNDKIKQLAEDAGFILWADEPWRPTDVIDWSARYDDELQKFAELIIRECSDIAEAKEQGDVEYNWDMSVGWYIRQRFGIK